MSKIQVPYDIQELSRQRAPEFHKVIKTHAPSQVKPGQIWSTHASFELPGGFHFATEEPRLVVILEGDGSPSRKLEQVIASPLSINITMASDRDFIVKKESGNSPLNFDFMIEVWNETPVMKGQLRQYLGSLTGPAFNALHELYMTQLQNNDTPEKLREWIGVRIVSENDPRLVFQEDEVEAVSYLAKAATAALEIPTEQVSQANFTDRYWIKFDIQPVFGKLSGFLRDVSVAQAASSLEDESELCLISQSSLKEGFTFELLNRRRFPYTIYLKVHNVSPDLLDHTCIITVKTQVSVWKSESTKLDKDITIEVGKDPNFRCEDVQTVEVAIEAY